jgi:hypothetical protein
MKRMIATAALLAVGTLHAAEELKFGDVNYFLKTGQFNAAADWAQTANKYTLDKTILNHGYVVETRFSYGFSNVLNVFVGIDYAFDNKFQDKTNTPKPRSYTHNGLSNPAFGATYRYLNQSAAIVNLDFGAIARINIQDQKVGEYVGQSSNDGNFANGRSSLELNAKAGRKWNEANEWQLAGGIVYNAAGNAEVQSQPTDTVDLDSSFNLFVKATYQYRPVNEFMMLLSAQATSFGEVGRESTNTNQSSTDTQHVDLDFRYTAKYLITHDFIAKFNYGQGRYSNYTREVSGGSNQEFKYRRNHFWGIGVDFLF